MRGFHTSLNFTNLFGLGVCHKPLKQLQAAKKTLGSFGFTYTTVFPLGSKSKRGLQNFCNAKGLLIAHDFRMDPKSSTKRPYLHPWWWLCWHGALAHPKWHSKHTKRTHEMLMEIITLCCSKNSFEATIRPNFPGQVVQTTANSFFFYLPTGFCYPKPIIYNIIRNTNTGGADAPQLTFILRRGEPFPLQYILESNFPDNMLETWAFELSVTCLARGW